MSRIGNLFVVMMLMASQADASPRRAITVEDCVRTRRIVDQEVELSPDGSRVAYVVKAPDLVTNRNHYKLYIRELRHLGIRENGHLLLQANRISGIRWLSSETIIARVENRSRDTKNLESQIGIVNATTGASYRLDYPGTIEEYSVSADGDTVVFSVKVPPDNKPAAVDSETQKDRDERGYAISFGEGIKGSIDNLPEDEIFLAKRTKTRKLEVRKLYFNESGHSPHRSFLRDVHRLNLSPDGKHLLVTYSAVSLPRGWADQPYIRYTQGFGTPFYSYILSLYDIETSRLRLGFNFPANLLQTSWSGDGRSYSVVGPSPFGTDDAAVEVEEAAASGDMDYFMNRFQHVFVVDVQTGMTTTVLHRENIRLRKDLPLFWKHSDGPMLIRTGDDTFAWIIMRQGQWREIDRFDLQENENFLSSLASDGNILVGVSQTTMIPPDLFALDLKSKKWMLLTDLNPEYREIQLGKVERLEWINRYGSTCTGFLIQPVGYQPGKRYPMVFLSAPPNEVFISDAVYTTAYAPQSLASVGFVVVVAQYPLDDKISMGVFPGDMSAAYNWMAMVEGAVDLLADRGMVDVNNVGIGGFSRTSWLTDFTLTHSSYNFVAASSADSGIYTYGAYFTYNSRVEMTASETQVGGPPYGEALKYWLKYAPPFNAEKVRAAILMEYNGTAEHGFEFFTALSRLGKAVELYRYPKGNHPLDTPFERVASLQRNVDWFRFWMEGYEGNAPDYDTSQYVRWRAIRSRSEAGQVATPPVPR